MPFNISLEVRFNMEESNTKKISSETNSRVELSMEFEAIVLWLSFECYLNKTMGHQIQQHSQQNAIHPS